MCVSLFIIWHPVFCVCLVFCSSLLAVFLSFILCFVEILLSLLASILYQRECYWCHTIAFGWCKINFVLRFAQLFFPRCSVLMANERKSARKLVYKSTVPEHGNGNREMWIFRCANNQFTFRIERFEWELILFCTSFVIRRNAQVEVGILSGLVWFRCLSLRGSNGIYGIWSLGWSKPTSIES